MLLGALAALSLIIGATICLVTGAFVGQAWLWQLPLSAFGCLLALHRIFRQNLTKKNGNRTCQNFRKQLK